MRDPADFLSGGGEMGALIRAYDWAASPLGPPGSWPQSLKVLVRLMLDTGHAMFVWWGPQLIQIYNDTYRRALGPEKHPSVLGGGAREHWSEIWHIIGPQIEQVMAGRGATWDEDRLVPIGRRQDVWWTASFSPITDDDGAVAGVLVICNDVTEQHLARETLTDQRRQFELLFERSPAFMAVVVGDDHVFEYANNAYRQLNGGRDFNGRTVREVLPELADGFAAKLDEVHKSGEVFVGKRVPVMLRRGDDAEPTKRYVDVVFQPFRGIRGEKSIFIEGVDVTEHVEAEERLALINSELKHRVKNTLAVVMAIASQTLSGTARDAALRSFSDRIQAFAKAHDMLTASAWAGASIDDVVRGALAPHWGDGDRFLVNGPKLQLGAKPALSLALAMHELATNAAKYGALSAASGRVTIEWTAGAPPLPFEFSWCEGGGPPVKPPTRRGFGSQLITRVLSADFGGEVELKYPPEGVVCRLRAPAANLVATSG